MSQIFSTYFLDLRNEHPAEGGRKSLRRVQGSYVLPGATDLDLLEELFEYRPTDVEATTVAGLVSEVAGRIPQPGEHVDHNGLRFDILESTDRRIERVRVSKLIAEPEPQPQKSGAA